MSKHDASLMSTMETLEAARLASAPASSANTGGKQLTAEEIKKKLERQQALEQVLVELAAFEHRTARKEA